MDLPNGFGYPRAAEPSIDIGKLILVPFLLIYLLWYPSFHSPQAAIFDEAGALDAQQQSGVQQELLRRSAALSASFVVVTSKTVKPPSLAREADQASKKLDGQQSWLWRKLFPASGHSIVYFYSEEPRLLQIRFGRYVQYKARLAELDYGPKYAAMQRMATADGTPDFAAISSRIESEFSKLSPVFYQAWFCKLSTFIDEELLSVLLVPHFELWEGLSSIAAVPLFGWLGARCPSFLVFAITGTLVLALATVAWVLMIQRVSESIAPDVGKVRGAAAAMVGAVILLALGVFIIVLYPTLGLLKLSAGQRAEDIMSLGALGVAPTWLAPQTIGALYRWLLVGLTAVMQIPKLASEFTKGPGETLKGLKSLFTGSLTIFLVPAWFAVLLLCLSLGGGMAALVLVLLAARDDYRRKPGETLAKSG